MTFSPDQLAALKAPLSKEHVKSRSQAGRSLSYIEGWHAIAEANRVFGFDSWDRETIEMRELGGEPRQVNGKWRVAFACKVRITVTAMSPDARFTETHRDGWGYGSGIAADLGDAYESAIKEAETDAMKRALMTFGNPFGLALYDKEQRNVVDEGHALSATLIAAMNIAETEAHLGEWYEDNSEAISELPANYQGEVRNAYRGKLQSLRQSRAA